MVGGCAKSSEASSISDAATRPERRGRQAAAEEAPDLRLFSKFYFSRTNPRGSIERRLIEFFAHLAAPVAPAAKLEAEDEQQYAKRERVRTDQHHQRQRAGQQEDGDE